MHLLTRDFSDWVVECRDFGFMRRMADTRNLTLANDTYDCFMPNNKRRFRDATIISL